MSTLRNLRRGVVASDFAVSSEVEHRLIAYAEAPRSDEQNAASCTMRTSLQNHRAK